MTVRELYAALAARYPAALSAEWDNDGLMCTPDPDRAVTLVLCALDVTDATVDEAIRIGADVILSHHPLIFKPLSSLHEDDHVARKVIKLIKNDIAVISFHTRADKVEGGVNDILCDIIGIKNAEPFGDGLLGRVGDLSEELDMQDFSYLLKGLLDCDGVKVADACIPVSRVAVVGGDGKSYIPAALAAGADTFVSGRIGYNTMVEAGEMGINLLEAGHFFTEHPVTSFFLSLLHRLDRDMYIEVRSSNSIRLI